MSALSGVLLTMATYGTQSTLMSSMNLAETRRRILSSTRGTDLPIDRPRSSLIRAGRQVLTGLPICNTNHRYRQAVWPALTDDRNVRNSIGAGGWIGVTKSQTTIVAGAQHGTGPSAPR